jgi:hypothetical protein
MLLLLMYARRTCLNGVTLRTPVAYIGAAVVVAYGACCGAWVAWRLMT